MTAVKNKRLLDVRIVRASRKRSVIHIPMKKIRMVVTRRSNGTDLRVEDKISRYSRTGFSSGG